MSVPMLTAQLVDAAGQPLGSAGAPLPTVTAPGEAHIG